MLVHFRKRVKLELVGQVNEAIVKRSCERAPKQEEKVEPSEQMREDNDDEELSQKSFCLLPKLQLLGTGLFQSGHGSFDQGEIGGLANIDGFCVQRCGAQLSGSLALLHHQ